MTEFYRQREQSQSEQNARLRKVSQLIRRRDLVHTDWAEIRSGALNKNKNFDLPVSAPDAQNVLCISVTNSFQFTSMQRDGIVVTDDVCLKRFFGDLDIDLTITENKEEVHISAGRIRKADMPTPQELLEYLEDPLQISLLQQDTQLAKATISSIDGEPKLAYYTSVYSGTSMSMLQTTLRDDKDTLQLITDILNDDI